MCVYNDALPRDDANAFKATGSLTESDLSGAAVYTEKPIGKAVSSILLRAGISSGKADRLTSAILNALADIARGD